MVYGAGILMLMHGISILYYFFFNCCFLKNQYGTYTVHVYMYVHWCTLYIYIYILLVI